MNSVELKKCPFCGSEKIEILKEETPSREAGYSNCAYFVSECSDCYSRGKYFTFKFFNQFSDYHYDDFKNNILLRVQEDEKYERYLQEVKQKCIEAWNTRSV